MLFAGDVNSRIGKCNDFIECIDNVPQRQILDEVKNTHGKHSGENEHELHRATWVTHQSTMCDETAMKVCCLNDPTQRTGHLPFCGTHVLHVIKRIKGCYTIEIHYLQRL